MIPAAALLLAVGFDGAAAHRDAASLASLGARPAGSPRAPIAAEFVAARLRAAGLHDVRIEPFRGERGRGLNVVGGLRGAGGTRVAVVAHHDSAAGSPSAWRAGGVGVLLELARVLAAGPRRAGGVELVSLDGGWSSPLAVRAYLVSRHTAGAPDAVVVLDGAGFAPGAPALQLYAHPDRLRPRGYAIAPAALVRDALAGAAAGGAPLAIADPLIPWAHQAAVRTARFAPLGADGAFLAAGVPALRLSDAIRSAPQPERDGPADDAATLDAPSLAALGRAALGVVERLAAAAAPARRAEPDWFAAFGRVVEAPWLAGATLVAALLGVVAARGERLRLHARLAHVALLAPLLWRHPVLASWLFLLPNLASGFPTAIAVGAGLLPVAALAAGATLGALGDAAPGPRLAGLWLAPYELIAFALALALLLARPPGRRVAGRKGRGGTARRQRSTESA